jgi:hypothetical protein
MKTMGRLAYLLLALITFKQANAQSILKKYEKAYYYYDKKDYAKAVEISSDLLTETKNIKYAADFWTLHNAAFILYFIYSDSSFDQSDKELSKKYLEISKQYLDMFISKEPNYKAKAQRRYDSISVWLLEYDVKKQTLGLLDKNEAKRNDQLSNNQVSIITSGEAITSELAVNSALRKAIESVLGAFISSKTIIANDSLLSDDFVSISSGNINSFEIISETKQGDLFRVVVSSVVSPEKIALKASTITGTTFELSGGLYYQNILKEEFYKKQELTALQNFYEQWKNIGLFNYEVQELEMFRYVAQTQGEYWMPRLTTYLGWFSWEFYKKDLYIYNNQELLALLKTEIEKENKASWTYLPKKYIGTELFQIPYQIKVTPNENYYKFIKSYADLLYELSIKNIQLYKSKFGDPHVFWHLIYQNLISAIESRKPYSDPMKYSSYSGSMIKDIQLGHIALRNSESIKIMHTINSIVLDQDNCTIVSIDGIKDLTFPPAFNRFGVRRKNQNGDDLLRFHTGEPYEFPYPTGRTELNGIVFVLLSFTKDELSKLNNKIQFKFSLL